MFDTTRAFSSFAVPDTSAATSFYRDTLGIEMSEQGEILGLQLSDGCSVMIYPKVDHAPAPYTILNFEVDDIDAAVDALAERGSRSAGTQVLQLARTPMSGGSSGRAISRRPGSPIRAATSCPSCSPPAPARPADHTLRSLPLCAYG